MNFRIRIILAQISLFASLSLILFSAQAEMIEVGPGHGYSRIQNAIDAMIIRMPYISTTIAAKMLYIITI